MRLTVLLLSLGVLLSGCGGGSSPAPSNTYQIQITPLSNAKQSVNASLAYGSDETFQVSITGGSTSDAGYPDQFTLVSADDQTITMDTKQCLGNSLHQSQCSFTLHNVYAGPGASAPLVDNVQVQAITNGHTIQSNSVPITLVGHASASSNIFYLKDISGGADRFGKTGVLHNGLEYQLQLTLTNPAKAMAPASATTFSKASFALPADKKIAVLNSQCSAAECTYTLQNENISSALQDVHEALSVTATVDGAPTSSTSNAVSLTLPAMQSCTLSQTNGEDTQGISLSTGALKAFENGKALTEADYTSNNMQQLYPINMGDYTIDGHHLALTVEKTPHLFSDQANQHIPSDTPYESGFLEYNSCDAAKTEHSRIYGKAAFVSSFTYPGSEQTQQCYDDKQIRYVYYAIPKGTPPSKNGWPVVIMLHGSGGQGGGYYLTPEDYQNDKMLHGSANFNVFNNQWNWSQWETNPVDPSASGSARYYSYSYYVRMRLIQTWLSRGFAVVVPTTWNAGAYDWWNYGSSYAHPWPYTQHNWPMPSEFNPKATDANSVITYFDLAYWPGVDQQFFEKLMAYLNNPSDYDSLAGNLKFDTHNLFLMGYSAGANMVSRLINEFPSMTYTDKNDITHLFPKIKGAIILSGGSYACYLKGDDECPADALEEHYNNSASIATHPPTLVVQSLHDDNAGGGPGSTKDPSLLAGSVYYQSYLDLCPKGSSCQPEDGGTDGASGALYQSDNLIQMIHTNNSMVHHYYFPEMVIPSLDLMLNHTCVAKASN